MEDLEDPGTPVVDAVDEPQGNQDPGDPLQPDIEEEHSPNAPIAEPTTDPDVLEDGAPDEQPAPDNDPAMDVDPDEDDESDLDELDEAQFDDFDADAANIVVPVAVDETNVGLLGVHKRKRTEEEERERKKKKKEGRRERISKKSKKRVEDGDLDGEDADGTRSRSGRTIKAPRRPKTPEDEETLSPEERRRRALERKMDEALRNSSKPSRRRLPGESVQDLGEAELETMRVRMAQAAERDAQARRDGQPASHKLLLLPKAVELLNRNTLKHSILDPDINILEAVRFFLEPADQDAALPNYQIQREMFKILNSLQMTKEALIASGIGKVVMFYTKSKQPQPAIKRMAEKLLQQWMSLVLNKKRSGKARNFEQRQFDPIEASQRAATTAVSQADRAEEKRRKALAAPVPGSRARIEGSLATYTIAPVNTLRTGTVAAKRMGAGGEEIFKRLQAKTQKQTGGVGRK